MKSVIPGTENTYPITQVMWTRGITGVIWPDVIRSTPPGVIRFTPPGVIRFHRGLSKIGQWTLPENHHNLKVSVSTRSESLTGGLGLSVHRWLNLTLLNLSCNVIGSVETKSLEAWVMDAVHNAHWPQSEYLINNDIEGDGTEILEREVTQDPALPPLNLVENRITDAGKGSLRTWAVRCGQVSGLLYSSLHL